MCIVRYTNRARQARKMFRTIQLSAPCPPVFPVDLFQGQNSGVSSPGFLRVGRNEDRGSGGGSPRSRAAARKSRSCRACSNAVTTIPEFHNLMACASVGSVGSVNGVTRRFVQNRTLSGRGL